MFGKLDSGEYQLLRYWSFVGSRIARNAISFYHSFPPQVASSSWSITFWYKDRADALLRTQILTSTEFTAGLTLQKLKMILIWLMLALIRPMALA